MHSPEILEAARTMAKCIFEANADEANRIGKPHIARSEMLLLSITDRGDCDKGQTIETLVKDWLPA
jgi:hypothetical protein